MDNCSEFTATQDNKTDSARIDRKSTIWIGIHKLLHFTSLHDYTKLSSVMDR